MPRVNIDELRRNILAIYGECFEKINWRRVLISEPGIYDSFLKTRAEKIINGDIDTYFEVLSAINPFDRLIRYGSGFEIGSDDPRMVAVHFHVNSNNVLGDANTLPRNVYNDLLHDYVCGCAIRIARDVLALLPIRHVVINAIDGSNEILSVDFTRKEFETLDFSSIDASDTVKNFEHVMDFDILQGFRGIG